MKGRPSLGAALLLALTSAGTTWAALTAWRGFLDQSRDYLAPLAVIAVAIAVVGAVLRWLGSPRLLTVAVQLVVATAFVSGQLGGGPVPIRNTGDRVVRSLDLAMESARTYAAPIGGDAPPVAPLLLVGGVVFILLVDLLACTFRRVPLAGLGLLAVYSVPAGLVESGPGWLPFLGASVGFLAMLHFDSREHLLRWGRPLGPDEHSPWTNGNPLVDAVRVGAGRIGVAATAMALVVPPLIPVLDLDLLGIGPGAGDGDIEISKPRADMRRDLEREADIPLVRVTTNDPAPSYLRIAVLNRFTGAEWSSGDRGVADANTATGDLPAPAGLSREVPRTRYDYDVDVTDALDSTWLPTQFPAAAVEADGDWRFDEDTMDFLAVPDDLDTAGMSYEMTALEPHYGTTGRFFSDADPGAVAEEFFEVPGGVPSLVRSLAISVTSTARTDYEAALLLQDWYRDSGGFRYSLAKAPEGTGGDTFETFLSEEPGGRVGYCEQFASAMAVMARILGIPARVAVGFLEPTGLGGGGRWEYSSHDLHAWPELYFEGSGWVRFEPTPSRRAEAAPDYSTVPVTRPENLPTNPATDNGLPQEGNTAPREDTLTVAPDDAAADGGDGTSDQGLTWAVVLLWTVITIVVLALMGALALAPRTLRERVRRRRLAGAADDLWDELHATALDLGVPWPAGRSPRETGEVLVGHLGDPSDMLPPERPRTGPDADPDATSALERIIAAVELARYARPGTTGPDASLGDDTRKCADALAAGATHRARTRARWVPRSLWQRPVAEVTAPVVELGAR